VKDTTEFDEVKMTSLSPVVYQLETKRTNETFIGVAKSWGVARGYWRCNRICTFGMTLTLIEEFPHDTPIEVAEARADFHANRLNVAKILEPLNPPDPSWYF